jgi:hypothetical protein
MIAKSANAQSISTPSAPTFNVQYVVYTFYTTPTYTINPYNGQKETTSNGYTQENQTLEFTIKNQPLTAYTDSSGNYIGLYYNFEVKGHFTDTWTQYPFASTGQNTWQSTWRYSSGIATPQVQNMGSPEYPASNSDYTYSSVDVQFFSLQRVPANSQVDFQVQALIGHIDPITYQMNPSIGGDGYYSFTGQASDWSTTQTITINLDSNSTVSSSSPNPTISATTTSAPASTPTSSPISTPTSAIPEFPSEILIITFLITATSLGTVVIKTKQSERM